VLLTNKYIALNPPIEYTHEITYTNLKTKYESKKHWHGNVKHINM